MGNKRRKYLQDISIVDFYNKPIITAYSDEVGYVVPMKYIIEEHIGLDWDKQRERMNSSPLYNPIVIPGHEFEAVPDLIHDYDLEDIPEFSPGASYVCLPVEELNLFLCQINTLKAREDVREVLYTYQKECGAALHDYWFRGFSVNTRTNPSRISSARHDWCPREQSSKSLTKAASRYSSFAERQFDSRLNPEEIEMYAKTVIAQILDQDSETWDAQEGALVFNLAFLERAAFDILYFAIEANVPPEDLQESLERNLNNAWEAMGTLVLSVQSPFTPFPGVGRGSPRELV